MTRFLGIFGLWLFLGGAFPAWAQGLLPADFDPDPAVPSPAEILGFEAGERHVTHHEMLRVFSTLAAASPRMHVEVIGESHGGRPLLLAYFHADGSAERIAALRDARPDQAAAGEGPLTVWLGYQVHGDEASAMPAAIEIAWYLAASRSERVQRLLEEAVVVVEPALNPDGTDRFAQWVNDNRGRHPNADPNDREHRQGWPTARTNYYWFDLNRDWLPLVHPESQARLAHYHQWLPHVVGDVHEMGHATTYFFQPGVPERNNPLTPQENFDLTGRIAEFHAAELDRRGEPYFTRELFDDYYVGKGSTYPDLTGGIGILFEQGSTRGHVMETPHGLRHFRDAIANQVSTSLSTLAGAQALADELRGYQRNFFTTGLEQGQRAGHAGWLVGDGGEPGRASRLVDLLLQHQLLVHEARGPVTIEGREYARGWVIPAAQRHFRLAASLLDPALEFPHEEFYDVSTWWLPAMFDVPATQVRRLPAHEPRALGATPAVAGSLPAGDEAVAWIIPWDQLAAPRALDRLLEAGAHVRVATREIEIDTANGTQRFARGALVLLRGLDVQPDLRALLAPLAREEGLVVAATASLLARSGPDLGAPSVRPLEPVRPLLLTGVGLSPGSAGQIWHWFDTVLQRPLTRVEWPRIQAVNLADYTHVLLPDGDYADMPERLATQLTRFVEAGGIVVGIQRGAEFAGRLTLEPALASPAEPAAQIEPQAPPEARRYEDFIMDLAELRIAGAILQLELDTSHPLAFGFTRASVPVFRQGATLLPVPANAYVQPGRYASEPVLSGYVSAARREALAGAPGLLAEPRGRGLVVRVADDYLFRGTQLGTWRLFANLVYFSQLVEARELPR
ncbi:MAG: hypothetical protein EA371_00795 [Gammaproteobacteria bacterium]|nr:MAG: hypothetical protein EA371_00795 [Gammaproteobacteria bacterium]